MTDQNTAIEEHKVPSGRQERHQGQYDWVVYTTVPNPKTGHRLEFERADFATVRNGNLYFWQDGRIVAAYTVGLWSGFYPETDSLTMQCACGLFDPIEVDDEDDPTDDDGPRCPASTPDPGAGRDRASGGAPRGRDAAGARTPGRQG